ncbi:MAG: 3-hydroxyacyl-ACP dehydratase [Mucilaginibacter sp.]|nr:3-hydroxyacyl-ACP dehydratase [Mucilaginibacter sp.]
MILSQENILSVIPQRPPFVMVDQLTQCDEISSHTTLLVKEGNVLVSDGELSEAGLIENIAQTAAAGVGYNTLLSGEPILTGYIGAIKNLEVFALPKVGDVIETEVTIEQQVFEVTIITGNVRCRGVLLAKCEMKIFIKK